MFTLLKPAMYRLTLLILVRFAVALEDEQIYCGPRYTHLCLGKGQHVGCQFPVAGSGPNCQNYSKIRFTSELRNYVTHFINKRRQRIAAGHERVRGGKHIPPPQVMMQVEWDFELARLAQRLADQCYFVHDECRATVKYPYAGQAVGEVRWRHLENSDELSAQRGIRRVFDAWWGERRRVEPHQLVQPFRITEKGLVWGHFSQIAVWTLRAVGCGAVRHGEDYPRLLLVCDFSHTNMLGEKTLIPGELAPCPERTRRKPHSSFPLLCTQVKEQIKQSRVTEDTLDETDYDDDDDDEHDNPEILAAREELKKLTFYHDHTGKPKHASKTGKKDWGVTRAPSYATFVDETTVHRTRRPRPTTVSGEDIDDEERDYPTSTPVASTTEYQKKLKIKLKPDTHMTAYETVLKNGGDTVLIDEDEYRRLTKSHRITSKLSGYHDVRERLPADLRVENNVSEEQSQETLILTVTNSPFYLKTSKPRPPKPAARHRYLKNNRRVIPISTTTEFSIDMIKNENMKNARKRWKPVRERPERPGASALLRPNRGPDKPDPAIPPRISFSLDEDVQEQLYSDTGYKPSWKTKVNETFQRSIK